METELPLVKLGGWLSGSAGKDDKLGVLEIWALKCCVRASLKVVEKGMHTSLSCSS